MTAALMPALPQRSSSAGMYCAGNDQDREIDRLRQLVDRRIGLRPCTSVALRLTG